MNCPTRDTSQGKAHYNQQPPFFSNDLTTNKSLVADSSPGERDPAQTDNGERIAEERTDGSDSSQWLSRAKAKVACALRKYLSFIGPGFLIAVAYIDPGNYSTDVAAGALFRFELLFVVFLSNVFAIFLQALSAKLGSVTGMDLAENCRQHLPRWLNIILYILAEAAIIATDLAEVIGSAIALKILLNVPLPAGVAITIVDVMIVLLAYRPSGPIRGVRFFEAGVALLVIGVAVCFCVELTKIQGTSFAEVMRGYLPNATVVSSSGLYISCGILGATVMPHSLYLGSGIVKPRLRAYDIVKNNILPDEPKYRPSFGAIKHTLSYTITEVGISLFTFALFINSAILIVAGATLSDTPDAQNADIFSIHDMLSAQLAPVAGTVFALALLLSGLSAGIVATLAGQMISEGFFNWTIAPWLRRLITRSIAIVPCLVIASVIGRSGLAVCLNASQVALSILLPFVTAPLVWFTAFPKYMRVPIVTERLQDNVAGIEGDTEGENEIEYADLSNGWTMRICSIIIWLFITVLNA